MGNVDGHPEKHRHTRRSRGAWEAREMDNENRAPRPDLPSSKKGIHEGR